jgi:hypothetical protein
VHDDVEPARRALGANGHGSLLGRRIERVLDRVLNEFGDHHDQGRRAV